MIFLFFEKDKQTALYQSSAAVSKNQALQLRAEIELVEEQVRSIAQGFYIKEQYFVRFSKELFQNNEKIHSLYLFQGKDFISSLKKEGYKNESFILSPSLNAQMQKELTENKTFVYFKEKEEGLPSLFIAFRILISEQKFFVLAEVDFPFNLSNLNGNGGFESVIYFSKNKMITTQNEVQMLDGRFEVDKNLESVLYSSNKRGILEIETKENETYLGAYSELGLGSTKVITFIKKSKVLDVILIILGAFGLIVCMFAFSQFSKKLKSNFR